MTIKSSVKMDKRVSRVKLKLKIKRWFATSWWKGLNRGNATMAEIKRLYGYMKRKGHKIRLQAFCEWQSYTQYSYKLSIFLSRCAFRMLVDYSTDTQINLVMYYTTQAEYKNTDLEAAVSVRSHIRCCLLYTSRCV